MANIQALQEMRRWTTELEVVRDAREYLRKHQSDLFSGSAAWPIKVDMPGAATDGYGEAKRLLQAKFDLALFGMIESVLIDLNERERTAKAQLTEWVGRL